MSLAFHTARAFVTMAPHSESVAHVSFGIGSRGDKFAIVHARQLAGPSLEIAGHKPGHDAHETGDALVTLLSRALAP